MRRSPNQWIKLAEEGTLIAVFLAVLLLPFADTGLELDPTPPPDEHRPLATRPEIEFGAESIRAFPKGYEDYANDSFGFRNLLIRWHSLFKVYVLKVSPSADVAITDNEWLFFRGDKSEEYQLSRPLSENQLRAWADLLEARRTWLKERGIRFLFVVAPNKHSIYPEHLPRSLEQASDSSPYSQLLDYLDKNTDVDALDLRPVFWEAKENDLVYDVTGTHWNELGAFHATRRILNRLRAWFPEVSVPSLDEYEIERRAGPGEELARMIYMADIYTEISPTLTRHHPPTSKRIALPEDMPRFPNQRPGRRPRMYEGDPSSIDVVMARDSFGHQALPFLREHFKTLILYPRQHFYASLDTDFQTDVVIMLMVERSLIKAVPRTTEPYTELSKDAETRKNPVKR